MERIKRMDDLFQGEITLKVCENELGETEVREERGGSTCVKHLEQSQW